MKSPAITSAISAREWFLLYLLSLLWGSSFLFFELSLDGLPPLTIVAIRMVLGASFLLAILQQRRIVLAQVGAHWRRCLLFGLIGAALPFACFAYAQVYITSSLAAVLNSTMPMFTFLIASAIGQEKFSALRLLGTVLGIIGVAILVGPSAQGNLAETVGALLCLVAAVLYAINTVAMRAWPGQMDASSLALGLCIGAAAVSVAAAVAIEDVNLAAAGWKSLAGAIGLGVLGTACAYRIFFYLLVRIGASNVSLCVLLIPVNAIPLGVIFLGEQLAISFFIGTAIIILSLMLVDRGISDSISRLIRKRG
ncbi:MAG: DMT family transporter [Betaproteobacteria bacterium]|nr:DMT family transporter [Betaproteobacteria bacterium]